MGLDRGGVPAGNARLGRRAGSPAAGGEPGLSQQTELIAAASDSSPGARTGYILPAAA
ncbi:hypothetical protein SBA6_160029 [Candidatus Sulfopaludibacter sp. SbA6]|nr:hypothetical protein SBA6_160029 [Candidatus Sulfopaludibacter sp. SbA6]